MSRAKPTSGEIRIEFRISSAAHTGHCRQRRGAQDTHVSQVPTYWIREAAEIRLHLHHEHAKRCIGRQGKYRQNPLDIGAQPGLQAHSTPERWELWVALIERQQQPVE